MNMYTTVFYKEGTNELVATEGSGTIPVVSQSKHPYYVIEGEFDGVVNPAMGINHQTREQRLEQELNETKERLQTTEDALFELMLR